MISIVIISLIFTYLYKSIDSLRFSNRFFSEKNKMLNERERVLKTLYRDIIFSKDIQLLEKPDSKEYSILKLKSSKNSLYNLRYPTIIWYVSTEDRSLIRLESNRDINLPLKYNNVYFTHLDRVAPNCNSFKLYRAKDSLLIYLNQDGSEELIFEINLI